MKYSRPSRIVAFRQASLFATRPVRTPSAKVPLEEAMLAAKLPLPSLEYVFALPRQWRFDYAWPPWRIALEIEGGGFGRLIVIERGYERRKGNSIPIKAGTRIRIGGRHHSGQGLQDDIKKYNRAAILGWLVIRATTTMVRDGQVVSQLWDAFHARGLE